MRLVGFIDDVLPGFIEGGVHLSRYEYVGGAQVKNNFTFIELGCVEYHETLHYSPFRDDFLVLSCVYYILILPPGVTRGIIP